MQGEVQEADATHYNPLDLFSGDLERMQQAVEAMLQNPARNLRVFSDGKRLVIGAVERCMSDWLQLPPHAAMSTASETISRALHQSGACFQVISIYHIDQEHTA